MNVVAIGKRRIEALASNSSFLYWKSKYEPPHSRKNLAKSSVGPSSHVQTALTLGEVHSELKSPHYMHDITSRRHHCPTVVDNEM